MDKICAKQFDNLELFWNYFLKCENEYVKQTYLELFLYEFYKSDKNELFAEKQSLLLSVPSQLSCHILQMIYSTICVSISTFNEETTTRENDLEKCNNDKYSQKSHYDNNLEGYYCKRNMMQQADDYKHVISLREFLLSGTGGRLLETLQCIGVNNVTCSRELTTLLINLFPTASWNDEDIPFDFNLVKEESTHVLELLDKLFFSDINHIASTLIREYNDLPINDENPNFLQNIDEYDILNEKYYLDSTNFNLEEYITDDFKLHIKRKMPSKQFSTILIKLLTSLVNDENLLIIDKSSSTLQSLEFGLEKLKLLNENRTIFSTDLDREKIRYKLLILVINCVNNIFLSEKNIYELFDLKNTITNLLLQIIQNDIADYNSENKSDKCLIIDIKADIIFGLYYICFIVINNTYLQQIQNKSSTSSIKELNENIKSVFPSVCNFLINSENHHFMFKKLIQIIIRIIRNINMNEENNSEHQNFRLKKQHKKCKNVCQNKISRHHNENETSINCSLESILLNILKNRSTSIEQTKAVLNSLQRSNYCCCNCNIEFLDTLYSLITKNSRYLRLILNFIKNNFMVILLNTCCDLCSKKLNSLEFQNSIIKFYIDLIGNVDQQEIYTILEHIAKLYTKQLPNELCKKIIFDITLVLFYNYKYKLANFNKNDVDTSIKANERLSKQIIFSCLNIFANYLNDINLIKEFFDEDIVQGLDDLLMYYEIVPNIFRLIKIGLIYLKGFNEENDVHFYQKLMRMPISATIEITNSLLNLFNSLNNINDKFNFKIINKNYEINREYPLLCKLRLSVVYWNMALQLLRTNEQFKVEFKNKFNDNHRDITLIALVYNILSCILNLNEISNSCDTTISSNEFNSIIFTDYCVVPLKNEIIDETDSEDCDEYKNFEKKLSFDINSILKNNQFEFDLFLLHENKICNPNVPAGILNINIYQQQIIFQQDTSNIYDKFISKSNLTRSLTYNELFNNKIDIISDENLKSNDYHLKLKVIFDINRHLNEIRLYRKYPSIFDYNEYYHKFASAYSENIINNTDYITDSLKYNFQSSEQKFSYDYLNKVVINSFGKINKFFNWIFSSEISNIENSITTIDYLSNENLNSLKSPECKKLLNQLFEITLSVLLLDVPNHIFETKMSPALEELKTLLLSHSMEFWNSVESGPAILSTLQSLLKIAKCKTDDNLTVSSNQDDIDIILRNNGNEFVLPIHSISNDNLSTDLDFSEDDINDETYLTADEGYDGDAENYNISETESNNSESFKSSTMPASHFRNCVIHKGICKVIVEILFDFCKRCVTTPNFWPGLLYQILTRLTVIRDSLGGSVFLLKGFRPILEINDNRLHDLQRSILELVTDLNTPEALSEYLQLFTSKNPPIELLLPRLYYLANTTSSKIQSTVQIEFPCYGDIAISSACDSITLKLIKNINEYHANHNLKTAMTQSKFIIPLNHVDFKPWAGSGFTATAWIKTVDVNLFEKSTNTCEEATIIEPIHILSCGNKKLILSVYLDGSDGSLYIHLIKPNGEIILQKTPNSPLDSNDTSANHNFEPVNSYKRNRRSNKNPGIELQGLNLLLENSNVDKSSVNTDQVVPEASEAKDNILKKSIKRNDSVLSNTCQALKNTTTILRSSLGNFNLFSLSKTGKLNSNGIEEVKPIQVQNIKLIKGKWTNLSFSVDVSENCIELIVTVDGTDTENVKIHCSPGLFNNMKKIKPSFLCIGANEGDNKKHNNKIGYHLSNVMIFKESIKNFSVIATLVTLGPDLINMNSAMTGNLIPNLSYLNNMKSVTGFDINATESINILRTLLIGVYSAHDPNKFLGYDFDKLDKGQLISMISFGNELVTNYVPSIQIATILSGGFSSLIFLFARVVELTSCPFLQSTSLSFFLQTIYSNSELYTEFVKSNGIELIGSVIRTNKCIKGLYLLKSVVEIACDGVVLIKKSLTENFQIITNTTACIIHADLLISIIVRYWDWYDQNSLESDILDALFSLLLALVREKHPHHMVNVNRLTKAGIISALLNFCKIYLVGASKSVYISKYAAENLVNLVRVFAGAPPLPSLLDEIIKLLILMHRPSDSFVTHDRSKFYFLLSASTPLKPKRLSLPLATAKLNSSFKLRERKTTIPLVNAPSASDIRRSISFDLNQSITSEDNWNEVVKEHESIEKNKSYEKLSDSSANFSIPNDNEMQCFVSNNKDIPIFYPVLYAKKKKKDKKLSRKKLQKNLNRKHKYLSSNKGRKKISFEFESTLVNEDLNGEKGIPTKEIDSNQCDLFVAYNSPGFIRVQEGLFNLLRDFILILPDNSVQEVLNHYVTIEILIVLSNHRDINVRTAIINLLSIICERLPVPIINQHTKQYYWYHLGNQVSLNPINRSFLNACVLWITGLCIDFDHMNEISEIELTQKYGLNILIAILPQTVYDYELSIKAFQLIENLYTKTGNNSLYMIENGLIFSILKTFIKIYSENNTNFPIIEKIINVLTTICYKSFISLGNINILWDVVNSLTYIEEIKEGNINIGARIAQSKILLHLVRACTTSCTNSTSLLNFKIKTSKIVIPGCLITSAELKTRFDLVIDRTVQFITNKDLYYMPNDSEFKLIQAIVELACNGNTRGSNIICWALCPARQIPLKLSIIRLLSNVKDLHKLNCDVKIIKIFAQSCLLTNRESFSETDLEMLTNFCNTLDGPVNSSWNLSEVLHRMEINREINLKEYKPSTERTIYKMEPISQSCIDSAMKITRNVVELQNMERRLLMNHMRTDDEKEKIIKWNMIIQNMTHENAPWYSSKLYPNSWELDHTEGPFRTLSRFKRCHRNVKSKFLMNGNLDEDDDNEEYSLLHYLILSIRKSCNFCSNEQVLYNFNIKHLSIDNEVEGELIITESQIIFMPNLEINHPILSDISSVSEIWLRRYQHQDIAVELFLESGNTLFFIMINKVDRDTLQKFFADKVINCNDTQKLNLLTQLWKERQLTNWEYLIILNQMSGRTYHDLMQYPVFPWILSDYVSNELDLRNPNNFRILEKPIAIQNQENEAHYISNYNYLSQSLAGISGANHMQPYHYGSHYSNSGTVLHFLVRILPFTKLFLNYQDNNFDIPDRTFHSINTTWRLASKDSPTDVKEIIPQFFTLPEMFENNEGFKFGVRQSGEIVDNVKLPPWCNNSSRLFILIHRQALESDIVRKNLNYWIDLIFGYKQTGPSSIDAINVFHPATYYGFSCQNMSDPVEKIACETMVRTYGQMPKQLLKTPHLMSNIVQPTQKEYTILPAVTGLKWGFYTGSLELPDPYICNLYQNIDKCIKFISLENTNVIYVIPKYYNLMQGNEQDTMNLILWNEDDNVVRIKPVCDDTIDQKILIHKNRIDPITACGTNVNSNQLWFGHKSGRITVYFCTSVNAHKFNKSRTFNHHANFTKLSYNSAFRKVSGKMISRPLELELMSSVTTQYQNIKWHGPVCLIRHTDEIKEIKISVEFKIAVSVGRDGIAAIWDINKLQYIRTISPSSSILHEIYLVEISSTLGDIITVHDVTKSQKTTDETEEESFEVTESNIDDFVNVSMNFSGTCMMRLYSINGKYINHVVSHEKIFSLCYSSIKEGMGINSIVTGMEGGVIKFWSSWDLSFIREIIIGSYDVISVSYSTYQHLVILTKDGIIQVWESPELLGTSPKLYFQK